MSTQLNDASFASLKTDHENLKEDVKRNVETLNQYEERLDFHDRVQAQMTTDLRWIKWLFLIPVAQLALSIYSDFIK